MEIREYEDLKKKLCKELEDIKSRKNIGMAEIEIIDKLTHSIKNLDKIIENEEEGGGYSEAGYRRYSRDGGNSYRGGMNYNNGSYGNGYNNGNYANNSYDGGNYGDSYANGNSYARRGKHYVRGHYSYAEDESGMITQRIEEMLQDNRLNMDDKNALRRAMDILEK